MNYCAPGRVRKRCASTPITSPMRSADSAPSRKRYGHGPERSRSEEHTSELQSRFELVCRLLLEKKKICYRQATDFKAGPHHKSTIMLISININTVRGI